MFSRIARPSFAKIVQVASVFAMIESPEMKKPPEGSSYW
jgi:hypothetical protein